MQRRFVRPLLAVVLVAALGLGVAGFAVAQNDATQQDAALQSDQSSGWFVSFLELMLSTPDRKIAISGLDGVFSANPSIARVTVADSKGVWLELDGIELSWNRAALFDRTIEIDSLKAARIAMQRRPVAAAESASGGGGLSPPPLAIDLKKISLPQIMLAAPVAGAAAELTATGSARLTQEAIVAELNVDRQDRAGSFALNLRLEPQANVLTADLKLQEPAGGLVAELLGLRGRPAVSVALAGTGPLDDWHGTLEMQAAGSRVLAGAMAVSRGEDAYRISADLAGALQAIAPEDYAGLLAGQSRLIFDVSRGDDGSIAVHSATLRSDGVDLAANGVLDADMVPQSADLTLKLGQAGRAALPFAPGGVSVASLTATAGLDPGDAAPWRATVEATGVEGDFGAVGSLSLDASGQGRNLARAASRETSFRFEASADGVAPRDSGLGTALGRTFKANGAGSWRAGNPARLDDLNVILTGATANFAGTATKDALSGDFAASVIDLSRFSALAGRQLGGRAELKASGMAGTDGAFDLKLDGATTDLALGIAALDPLLKGATKLSGGAARSGAALRFTDLTLANDRMSAELNGTLADPAIDMAVKASVADLSLVTDRASGAAKIDARVTGTRAAPEVSAEATGDKIVLMERPLADARARFSGVVAGPATSGEAELTGTLGDAAVRGTAKLSAGENGARAIDDLRFAVGKSEVTGALTLGADGLMAGNLSVVSPDLSKVAPLFLVDASGMLRAEIALKAEDGGQTANVSGVATDITYENVTLHSAEIKGRARDLFRAPQIEGDFSLRDLKAGGLTIVTASGTAERAGSATNFSVDAALADGKASLVGNLAPQDGGLAIGLKTFAYKRPGIDVALAEPTTIAVRGGAARFERTTLRTGGGSVVVTGSAGSTLDLNATLSTVPAALVNAFSPELGAEGTVSGVVTAKGSASDPNATFDITLAGASVAASRNAGLGALGVSARGTLAKKRVDLTSEIFGADGMSVRVTGTVGTAANAPLDLRVSGGVPLALGNRQLASRGAALQGALNVNITVAGTTSSPRFSGRVTSEGGGFVDPETGIVLKDLTLVANVSGTEVVIETLNAKSGEGTVSAKGRIGLDPNAGFPVDLTVEVRKARYVDGTLIASRFDADLTMSGRFSEGPLLKGTVTLDRTEITVPEQLPRDSVAVDVKHIDPPPPVEETLAIVRERQGRGSGRAGPSSDIRLDVVVKAPRQIFVRGRGLDAEFGGQLRLAGALSALTASGGFEMVRGRLDILTQRIAFDRGVITFAGDLDPILDFTGSTRSGDVTITVTVSGRASNPEVTFSSVPELPQDEILAQLIFKKTLGNLSPLQVARLAAAVSELSGGSGGVLSRLRASTGLDDLDIVTNEEGQTAVAAGRYVTENVYIGVQQGAGSETSRVTIDLDVTKNLKARAGYSASGGFEPRPLLRAGILRPAASPLFHEHRARRRAAVGVNHHELHEARTFRLPGERAAEAGAADRRAVGEPRVGRGAVACLQDERHRVAVANAEIDAHALRRIGDLRGRGGRDGRCVGRAEAAERRRQARGVCLHDPRRSGRERGRLSKPREGVHQDRRRRVDADEPRHRRAVRPPHPDADHVPPVEADRPGVAIAVGGAGLEGYRARRRALRAGRAGKDRGDVPGGALVEHLRRRLALK